MSDRDSRAALLTALRRSSESLARLDADDEEAVENALAERGVLLEGLRAAGDAAAADPAYREGLQEALRAGKDLAHRLRLSRALAVSARNEATRIGYAIRGFEGGWRRTHPRTGMRG